MDRRRVQRPQGPKPAVAHRRTREPDGAERGPPTSMPPGRIRRGAERGPRDVPVRPVDLLGRGAAGQPRLRLPRKLSALRLHVAGRVRPPGADDRGRHPGPLGCRGPRRRGQPRTSPTRPRTREDVMSTIGRREPGPPPETPNVLVPKQARGADDPSALSAPSSSERPTVFPAAAEAAAASTGPSGAAVAPAARRRLRSWLSPLISVAIVVGVFWFFLPQFTSISAVGKSIRSMSPLALRGLLVAAAWNLVTYWLVMVSTMPGLRYREAAVVPEASTAVSNTLPSGGAIGIAMSYQMYYS